MPRSVESRYVTFRSSAKGASEKETQQGRSGSATPQRFNHGTTKTGSFLLYVPPPPPPAPPGALLDNVHSEDKTINTKANSPSMPRKNSRTLSNDGNKKRTAKLNTYKKTNRTKKKSLPKNAAARSRLHSSTATTTTEGRVG